MPETCGRASGTVGRPCHNRAVRDPPERFSVSCGRVAGVERSDPPVPLGAPCGRPQPPGYTHLKNALVAAEYCWVAFAAGPVGADATRCRCWVCQQRHSARRIGVPILNYRSRRTPSPPGRGQGEGALSFSNRTHWKLYVPARSIGAIRGTFCIAVSRQPIAIVRLSKSDAQGSVAWSLSNGSVGFHGYSWPAAPPASTRSKPCGMSESTPHAPREEQETTFDARVLLLAYPAVRLSTLVSQTALPIGGAPADRIDKAKPPRWLLTTWIMQAHVPPTEGKCKGCSAKSPACQHCT
jgi:hypothetical protein